MVRKAATVEVSKSQLVKDYLAKHADAKVKDVKEGLATEGHEVSVALINKIKYSKSPKRSGKKPGRKASKGHTAANGAVTSKAQAIRDAFATLGKTARTSAVVEHLAEKKVEVSSAQVSGLRKRKRRRRVATTAAGAAATNPQNGLSLEHLLAAKKLTDQVGVEVARKAIDALSKLGL